MAEPQRNSQRGVRVLCEDSVRAEGCSWGSKRAPPPAGPSRATRGATPQVRTSSEVPAMPMVETKLQREI